MDSRTIPTPYGPIVLSGEADAFTSDRPLVVGIAGAFAIERGPLWLLAPILAPHADVVAGHLPGNHCPLLIAQTVGTYAAAYSYAIAKTFPDRPVIPCGLSIGGLVALGLRAPNIRRAMVVEPPLVMSKIWPMWPILRIRLAREPDNAALHQFILNIFGVTEGDVEERRYDSLLAGLTTPTHVLVGEQPLFPEREVRELPSLVDAPERELLRRHPAIRASMVTGAGHNVPQEGAHGFVGALRALVAEETGG